MRVSFELNGDPQTVEIEPDAFLVDVVRGLGLTGTKEGCAAGVCGACTVVVDELPVSSCLYLAACAEGRRVLTVEGIAAIEPELVDAFVEQEGMQCGACTPGQVAAAYTIRREHPDAGETEIRAYFAGNLCRCTGYQSIVDSVSSYLGR